MLAQVGQLWVTCSRPFIIIIKLIIICIGFQFVIRVWVLNRNWTSCDPPGEGTEFELKFNAQRLAESAADSQNSLQLEFNSYSYIFTAYIFLVTTCVRAIRRSLSPSLSPFLSSLPLPFSVSFPATPLTLAPFDADADAAADGDADDCDCDCDYVMF